MGHRPGKHFSGSTIIADSRTIAGGSQYPACHRRQPKWLEQYLTEYRKQTAALTDDFAGMEDIKHGELKDIVLKHAETVKRDALFVSNRLVDANDVAKSIQKNLRDVVAEWNQSKNAMAQERQRFEKVCRKLDEAINLRGVHWYILGTLAACVVALPIGHYVWHH